MLLKWFFCDLKDLWLTRNVLLFWRLERSDHHHRPIQHIDQPHLPAIAQHWSPHTHHTMPSPHNQLPPHEVNISTISNDPDPTDAVLDVLGQIKLNTRLLRAHLHVLKAHLSTHPHVPEEEARRFVQGVRESVNMLDMFVEDLEYCKKIVDILSP